MQYFIGFVSPGSAETDNGCGRKLNSHSIASCVRNIGVKNYSDLIILLQVTIENVWDFFSGHGVYKTDSCKKYQYCKKYNYDTTIHSDNTNSECSRKL